MEFFAYIYIYITNLIAIILKLWLLCLVVMNLVVLVVLVVIRKRMYSDTNNIIGSYSDDSSGRYSSSKQWNNHCNGGGIVCGCCGGCGDGSISRNISGGCDSDSNIDNKPIMFVLYRTLSILPFTDKLFSLWHTWSLTNT